jgi:hypothetical protein
MEAVHEFMKALSSGEVTIICFCITWVLIVLMSD